MGSALGALGGLVLGGMWLWATAGFVSGVFLWLLLSIAYDRLTPARLAADDELRPYV
jgi:hypothetical protein